MNILFIGDYRSAANYGSIATTECLIDLINSKVSANDDMKIIDRRSYDHSTPKAGFNQTLKYRIRKKIPLRVWQKMQHVRNIFRRTPPLPYSIESYMNLYHVPCLYKQFETYFNKMDGGNILQYEKELLEWADIVIINGEGTIVNGVNQHGVYNGGGRYTIYMAWLSKIKYNKTTALVNLTVDPGNNDAWEMLIHTLPHLDYLYLREPLSIPKLADHGISNGKYVPDALFSYEEDESVVYDIKQAFNLANNYMVLGDTSAFNETEYQSSVRWDVEQFYDKLIPRLQALDVQVVLLDGFNGKNKQIDCAYKRLSRKHNMPMINLSNCDYHRLYAVFKHSKLFISGRWHASILASLSYTPLLLFGSDSHKTKALYKILDYPYPFFDVNTLPLHIDEIVEAAKSILADTSIVNHLKVYVGKAALVSKNNVDFL